MVDLARTQANGRAQVDRAVLGELLPYADGAFDRVICALAIHYAADRHAAFTGLSGDPMAPDRLTRTFKPAVRAGLPPIRLHDLRYGAASLGLSAGVAAAG